MARQLKSPREIDAIARAGVVVAKVLHRLGDMCKPGVQTQELDAEADRLCRELGGESLFKGVPGHGGPFPGNICCSINEQVVHGIPSARRVQEGDVVSVDYGVRLDGWCADSAATFIVGEVPPRVRQLATATREALEIAIGRCRPGVLWSTVARAMQQHVEGQGFSLVRELVGHGIGKAMHEDPKVPNFVSRELLVRDILLENGLVIAVEPMVCMGRYDIKVLSDGWTVVTRDGQPSAHFEHTLAIVPGGVRVLTTEG